jgi:hypothetical protein
MFRLTHRVQGRSYAARERSKPRKEEQGAQCTYKVAGHMLLGREGVSTYCPNVSDATIWEASKVGEVVRLTERLQYMHAKGGARQQLAGLLRVLGTQTQGLELIP